MCRSSYISSAELSATSAASYSEALIVRRPSIIRMRVARDQGRYKLPMLELSLLIFLPKRFIDSVEVHQVV